MAIEIVPPKDCGWKVIGQIYSDHGFLTLCDSTMADDAFDMWMDSTIDLNQCASNNVHAFQLQTENECPIGVAFKPAFGDDALFDVEARYEQHDDGHKVIAEIRVKFL